MSKRCMTIGGDYNEGLRTVTENGRCLHTAAYTDEGISFRLAHDDVTDRVNRGGSWSDTADSARAASRNWSNPGDRFVNLGLRLCADWRAE